MDRVVKTVIFDCDGTLVDSEVLANEVLVEAVAEHGLVLSVDDAVRSFRGGKMADCVALLEARFGRRLPADFAPSLRVRTAAAFRSYARSTGHWTWFSPCANPFAWLPAGPWKRSS